MTDSSGSSSQYGSYYGTLADYFAAQNGNRSQGKAGGAGGSAQQYAPPQSSSSGGGSSGGSDNTQGGNAQSGANSWISAAVSQTSSDKSQFTTPFSQQFGGITNNQVINSPNATGATTVSPIAPITGTTDPGNFATTSANSLVGSPLILIAVIFGGVALVLHAR